MLDLGRVIFAGSVLAQLLPGARLAPLVLIFGAVATMVAVCVGLAIIPEEES